ncbi:hypothetical protein Trydic_g23232 [Trypoxylus dichotomus]
MSQSKETFPDDIVISGLAGRFATANNVQEFKNNLFNKIDMVLGDFGKWHRHPELPKWTGKMSGIAKFDRGFFGITSSQAENMDPQMRIALEKTFEAIIDAGYHPSDFAHSRTGVFATSSISETEKGAFFDALEHYSDSITGTQRSMLAKRISYCLQLKGPSYHLDSACSSSLYILEHAYTAIKVGKCDKAFVCGMNLCLHAITSLQFIRLGVLSKAGKCMCFDEDADGYARSEGVVVMLLEKARGAKRIYSKVVHVKTNCDGFKNEGITFPSSVAQMELMNEFYEECKVDPRSLTFLEAHCAGTKVGDPEELNSVDKVLCKNRREPLHIGSVKSNLGHTEPVTALCSIIKLIIAMETGSIPPNINYKTPRKGVRALETGTMIVVTEKLPLPNQRGLFGVNSFGFGGANAHALLHWNPKIKSGKSSDDLPKLICVSSRTAEGVAAILDDFKDKDCDCELACLIQQAFRNPIENHLFRGFGIYDKDSEIKRSLMQVQIEGKVLYLVFSNFDKGWSELASDLMMIPIFARHIQSFQNLLIETIDQNISRVKKFVVDREVTGSILKTVGIQISLFNILKLIGLRPNGIIGFGMGEIVAGYLNYRLTLEQMVLKLFYMASELTKANLLECISAEDDCYSKNIVSNRDGIFLVIGANNSKNNDVNIWNLINADTTNCILDFLESLGSLYKHGFEIDVSKLYPAISLPVSRGTPMLSPLIKWEHKANCRVHLEESETQSRSQYRTICIAPKSEKWSFLSGHVVDGRNLFPATGYLILAWETLSRILDKSMGKMRIAFENVRFIRGATIPKEGGLTFLVSIQIGTNDFEIVEGGSTIVKGRIYEMHPGDVLTDLPVLEIPEIDICMTSEDIYKEFKVRGYQYRGKFKNIKKCNLVPSKAKIQWDNNWVSYIDCLLQLVLLWYDSRDLYLPTQIAKLQIDSPKHFEAVRSSNSMMEVFAFKELNLIKATGIEIQNVDAISVSRRKAPVPVLETYRFVSNYSKLDARTAIRTQIQVILENVNVAKAHVVEICSENQDEADLLYPTVQTALDDIPLVVPDIIVFGKGMKVLKGVNAESKSLNAINNCLILIVCEVLTTKNISSILEVVKDANGFIISREKLNANLSKFSEAPFKIICSHELDGEKLVLLRFTPKSVPKIFLDLSNALDDLQWLPKLQGTLRGSHKVIIYVQNDAISGILGLISCLRKEYKSSEISCFFIMDEAPKFDPNLDFYAAQLEKDMVVNIWKNGSWGTYRHLVLTEGKLVQTEHSFLDFANKGDLSSATWIEGKSKSNDIQGFDEDELIHVCYSALNFKDLLLATGRINSSLTRVEKIQGGCVQGFEFAGYNSKGHRVMGVNSGGSLSTLTRSSVILPIPDEWSMEEAATVLVAYGTVVEALFKNPDPKPNESILIHSATGGVGQAAINLCLYFGLRIFLTVGSKEKREFIKKHYPQIEERHIGNSRDTSFEEMILKQTEGKGVNYVLNSLAEDKLLASLRCLARGGKFLEIGQYDLTNNNAVNLYLLEKEIEFLGLGVDKRILASNSTANIFKSKMLDLIKEGAIRPLPRIIFKHHEVQDAFKLMAGAGHIGKVLIKLGNEETPLQSTEFLKSVPRFYCKSNCSYLICGGLGGIGLELADFLVSRGARNLVLTSRSGLITGYQKYRMKTWENYGVTTLVSTLQASTEESCLELLRIANQIGPLDGVFNLAVVLKDALLENQSMEDFNVPMLAKVNSTRNLDLISRKLYPDLRYFVVFSSFSSGKGIIGQTNYAMANSTMERICEIRKKQGYPALAVQWAAIGEVGIVAKMQGDDAELTIEGTSQQRISSCLELMDRFLTLDDSVVASTLVAEKMPGKKASDLFQTILSVIGVRDLKSVSVHATFPELGVDSIMVVEIMQILEREYEIVMTSQDIRGMTLKKLRDLSNTISI